MSISSFNSTFSSFPSFVDDSEAMYATAPRAIHKRRTSAEHNAAMRELIKPWGSLSESPLGCRTVMYSSWSKFSCSDFSSKSTEDMKASVVWSASGTTPDFNPPLHERTYLGVDQPKPVKDSNPRERRPYRRAPSALRSSWSTTVSNSDASSQDIMFKRQAVKPVGTSSLITQSLRADSGVDLQEKADPVGVFAKALGKELLSASMLPSAFDSDSEDEYDEK